MTWHQDYGSASILGPSAKELRQKPRRNCRRLVRDANDRIAGPFTREELIAALQRHLLLVGIALGASGLVTLFASPAIGAIADRFGHWRVLCIAAVVDGILWLLPWVTRDYWPFVIAFALVSGIGSGVFSLSFNVLASSATDAARARVMTFAYLPLNLGFIVGPGLGAFIVSRDVFAMFPAATAFELVGVLLLVYASRKGMA